jgi:hypothetical protein
MSKPIEEMVAVLWEDMLRQIETRVEERIEAAITNIPKGPIPCPEPLKPQESGIEIGQQSTSSPSKRFPK